MRDEETVLDRITRSAPMVLSEGVCRYASRCGYTVAVGLQAQASPGQPDDETECPWQ